MIRYAAFSSILLVTVAPAQQAGPNSPEEAQRLIFAALNDARFTIQESNPPVLGWYKGGASDPCLTRYTLTQPAHVKNGASVASQNYSFGISWHEVKDAVPEPSNPLRIRVTRINATQWFSISGARQAQFLSGAAYLIKACKPGAAGPPTSHSAGPAPAPSQDLGYRTHVGKEEGTGLDQCRFRLVPELMLVRRSEIRRTPARAKYSAPAVEAPGVTFTIRLSERSYQKTGVANWRATRPSPGFDVPPGWRLPVGTSSMSILLDGRKSALTASRGNLWQSTQDPAYFLDNPMDNGPGSRLAAIESMNGVSKLTWQFVDSAGRVLTQYNFDIRAMHKVPGAIIAANWACP